MTVKQAIKNNELVTIKNFGFSETLKGMHNTYPHGSPEEFINSKYVKPIDKVGNEIIYHFTLPEDEVVEIVGTYSNENYVGPEDVILRVKGLSKELYLPITYFKGNVIEKA